MRGKPELFIGKRRTKPRIEWRAQNDDRSLQNLGIKPVIGRFSSEPMNKTFRALMTNAGAQRSYLGLEAVSQRQKIANRWIVVE